MATDDAPTGIYVNERLADGSCRFHYHRRGSAGSRLSATTSPTPSWRPRRPPLHRHHPRDLDVRGRSGPLRGTTRARAGRPRLLRGQPPAGAAAERTRARGRRSRCGHRLRLLGGVGARLRRRRSPTRPRGSSCSRSARKARSPSSRRRDQSRCASGRKRRRERRRRRARSRLSRRAGRGLAARASAHAGRRGRDPVVPVVRRRALLSRPGRARRGGRVVNVLDELARQRILPVLRCRDAEDAIATARAAAAAGCRVVEVTMSTPGAEDAIAPLVAEGLLVAVGTVRDASAVRGLADLGASMVVSFWNPPGFVAAADDAGIPAIPGGFTTHELAAAHAEGAAAVKLFPAGLADPSYLAGSAPAPAGPAAARHRRHRARRRQAVARCRRARRRPRQQARHRRDGRRGRGRAALSHSPCRGVVTPRRPLRLQRHALP